VFECAGIDQNESSHICTKVSEDKSTVDVDPCDDGEYWDTVAWLAPEDAK
jgi:hypothetical protein